MSVSVHIFPPARLLLQGFELICLVVALDLNFLLLCLPSVYLRLQFSWRYFCD